MKSKDHIAALNSEIAQLDARLSALREARNIAVRGYFNERRESGTFKWSGFSEDLGMSAPHLRKIVLHKASS